MAQDSLKAQFFVARKDGTMVPLLAVDELPHHIVIFNVSRVMSPFDITGMTCVGLCDFRHRQYNVQDAPELAAGKCVQKQDTLKARYFITRNSGNMVPLVAMDEMPESFVVEGVPRTVSVFDLAGMTCVGTSDIRGQFHTIEDVKNAPLSYFAESAQLNCSANTPLSGSSSHTFDDFNSARADPFSVAHDGSNQSANEDPPLTPPEYDFFSAVGGPATPRVESPSPDSSPNRAISADALPQPAEKSSDSAPPAKTLYPGSKEFCSYWIRHGECDYQQQGCLYKHEMPLDKETLSRLGLRDIPRWYREKHSLGSYLAAGGAGAAFSGQGLKSATASGSHEDDKQNKFAGNWRAKPHTVHNSRPPATRNGLRNAPRSNKPALNPLSFSRTPATAFSTPLFGGKLRRNETLHSRQQLETIQALNIYARMAESRQQAMTPEHGEQTSTGEANISAAQPVSGLRLERHPSMSSMISDVEAVVGREDKARKAKEEAEYALAKRIHHEKASSESPDTVIATKEVKAPKGNRGSSGSRRGGRNNHGRGHGRRMVPKGGRVA